MPMLRALALVSVCVLACSAPHVDGSGNLSLAELPETVVVDEALSFSVAALNNAKEPITAYAGTVEFSSSDRAAQLSEKYTFSGEDEGQHRFVVTFRTPGRQSLTVRDPSRGWTASKDLNVRELVYTEPPANQGKIRLVRDTSAAGIVLKLVAAVNLKGYAVGFNLPLQQPGLTTSTELLVPGDALMLGQPPLAVGAAVGEKGPLTGILVTGVSQKAAGAGAVTSETEISAGQVFYSFRLRPRGLRTPGVVFDGAAPGARFRGALRNREGQDVVSSGDFAIGRLELK
jgi:hypothetical protein